MRVMIASLLTALLVVFAGAAGAAGPPSARVCWPLHFAGVTLGVNHASEVERLLGKGVARPREGDTGGLYYVDPARSATLHVEFFTDSVAGELTLQQGISRELKPAELDRAESKWFNPSYGFGNWGALHLGSSKKDVTGNLGVPTKGSTNEAWKYQSACACELPEYFTLYFRSGRIVKVVFSAPAG